jgi:segregation and condensation protein A
MTGRGNLASELQLHHEKNSVYEELTSVDLYKLLKTFHRVLNRLEDRESTPKHVVVQYPYSIEGQRKYLLNKVSAFKKVDFVSIVQEAESKVEVIFTFLAILELIQLSKIAITVGEGYNNFWLEQPLPEAA